jgi:hypothetical protein
MPELVGHDRQAAERRLQALKLELHALPDHPEIPPLILAVRVRRLVREIESLQRMLGGRLAVESGLRSQLAFG